METPQQEVTQTSVPSKWNQVTPLSKYLSMALFTLLPFAGFWAGMQYAPIATSSVLENSVLPSTEIVATNAVQPSGADFSDYASLNLRLIKTVPVDSDEEILIYSSHATEGITCGNYTEATCYLFHKSMPTGEQKLIGTYRNGYELNIDSVTLKDQNTLEFKGIFGEGSFYGTQVWNMDLSSGKSTMISENREQDGEALNSDDAQRTLDVRFKIVKTTPIPGPLVGGLLDDPKQNGEFIVAALYTSTNGIEHEVTSESGFAQYYFFGSDNGTGLRSLGWWDGSDALWDFDSIKYIPSTSYVQFKTSYGDAGCSSSSVWSVDLQGKGVKNVSTTSSCKN